jgi:orotate phosphoribosyltransferase
LYALARRKMRRMSLDALPIREGHFLLESGMHAALWIDLDALFVDPAVLAPAVDALARALTAAAPTAICGPLLGGAFLAQALATTMQLRAYCTERVTDAAGGGLFRAAYRVPAGQRRSLASERVVVVDDAISAGSSVRATIAAVRDTGATVSAVGALLTLGSVGLAHFEAQRMPVIALERWDFPIWPPEACPLCARGVALEQPA